MTLSNFALVNRPAIPVNREKQIDEFRSTLERIRVLGSIFQTIYEWYGPPGIGKSYLTRMLLDECEKASVPYGVVDFNSNRNPRVPRYKEEFTTIVEDLAAQLDISNIGKLRQAITANRRISPEGQEKIRPEHKNVAREFIRSISELTEHGPVVLLFDECELAEQEIIDWLEEWIFSPLVQSGRCLIVWTGRRPQRWKRFEVRRRLRSLELEPFNNQGTKKLFQENSEYPLAELSIPVRRITGGHPMADFIALRHLEDMARSGKALRADQFTRVETTLLDDLVQEFVEAYAFKGLSEELASACRVLSLVRQFDVILMREILTNAVPFFAQYERDEFGSVLSRLRSTQLILWDDRRKGYALDPTLRHILGEHICRHRPGLYAQVNRIAIRVYQDWIIHAGDNRSVYIVEELYQQACLNKVHSELSPEERVVLIKLLKQRLQEYPQRDPDLRASALDRLYHELENDPDLPGLIGVEKVDELLRLVREARTDALISMANNQQ